MSNIPTSADVIDPTNSINSVRRSIMVISIICLASTRIIIDLRSTGGSLIAPPFEYMPLNSYFTFCFSYIFIYNKVSTFIFLSTFLLFLILRSLFDFYLYQLPTTRLDIINRIDFRTKLMLQDWLDQYLQENHSGTYKKQTLNYEKYKKTFCDKLILKYMPQKLCWKISLIEDPTNQLYTMHALFHYCYHDGDKDSTDQLISDISKHLESNLAIEVNENKYGPPSVTYKHEFEAPKTPSKDFKPVLVEMLLILLKKLPNNLALLKCKALAEVHTSIMFYIKSLWATVFGVLILITNFLLLLTIP